MIKSVHLINFQSHKDTLIKFSQGVNAIVGPSDSGKTAVLRALNWVFNNRPLGSNFVSWFKDVKETRVTVQFTDGYSVARIKNKDNSYEITTPSGETSEIKNFGQNVPEEVQEVLNLSSVNIQYQMDAPFLLSWSPGQVGQYLNDVAHLDAIDRALSGIARILKSETREQGVADALARNLASSLESYGWLDKAEGRLAVLESLESDISAGSGRIRNLTSLLKDLSGLSAEIDSYREVTRYDRRAQTYLDLMEEVEALKSRISSFSSLIRGVQGLEEEIREYGAMLNAGEGILALESLISEIQKQEKRKSTLMAVIEETGDWERVIAEEQENLEGLEAEYHELMPEECPLCGK